VGDSIYASGPSTPRLGSQHVLEQTDATIMPGPVRVASSSLASMNEMPTPASR
jgi:hypothetical protein